MSNTVAEIQDNGALVESLSVLSFAAQSSVFTEKRQSILPKQTREERLERLRQDMERLETLKDSPKLDPLLYHFLAMQFCYGRDPASKLTCDGLRVSSDFLRKTPYSLEPNFFLRVCK